jgi:tetratricopeptide (TPR) repeat protein
MEDNVDGEIGNKQQSKLEALEAEVAANPASTKLLVKLGGAFLRSGATKKAERTFEQALEVDPNCIPALINLGGIYLNRWDFEKCVTMNQKVSTLDPSLLEAPYNEGLGYLYQKKTEEMIECFRRVIALDEKHAGGHYHLAVGLLALGQSEEAKKEVAIAMELGYKPEPAFLKALEKDRRKVEEEKKDTVKRQKK